MIDAMRKEIIFLAAVLLPLSCAKEVTGVSPVSETESSGLVIREGLTPPKAGTTVIRAGFDAGDPDTRSRLDVNAAGTQADVLWTAGDSFNAVFADPDGNFGYAVDFTTEEDGVASASFSTPYYLTGYKWFNCFYPNGPIFGNYNGYRIFGLDLPAEQTAVAGGIAEGLNRAYAYADELTPDLQGSLKFRNLTSMLRFRLEGAVASRVKEVTFVGSGVIAGDMILRKSAEDSPELEEYPNLHYYESYSKIVLKGDFEAGKDYYIVLWPRQMGGFRMVFSDGEGNTTTKYSTKNITFESSRIKDFGTIALGNEFEDLNDGSLDPIKYLSATEGTKPVTIAVIPEGFTKAELPLYEQLAKQGINALFDTEPYKTYRNRFNAYILKVPSRESGASITDGNGNITTQVATYFGIRWGTDSYGDMQADASTVYSFVTEKCPDIVNGIHTIDEVPILIIINDERYGGICNISSTGRGHGMVPYVGRGGGLAWSLPDFVAATDDPLPTPVTDETLQTYSRERTQADMNEVGGSNYGDWRNIVVHEFGGHCFARLGDEYWTTLGYDPNPMYGHDWPVPYSLNVSSDPAATPWKTELLDRLSALVARDARYGRIGVFQGAGGGSLFGRWRSEKISCMIDNRFYFSAWQRYLITQRIFSLSDDLASFSFESWLAKDVTADPVRDAANSPTPGLKSGHTSYTLVGPLPPPILED